VKPQNNISFVCLLLIGLLIFLPTSSQPTDAQVFVIRIGHKSFTENLVLAHIVGHMLNSDDAMNGSVFVSNQSFDTFTLREQLQTGEIDIYVEYTATGVLHLDGQFPDQIDETRAYSSDAAFLEVSNYDLINNSLVWLPPAPGNNIYAIAVKNDFATQNNIFTIEDFANFVNDGNQIIMSSGSEFCDRPDGLAAYQSTYNFQLLQQQLNCIADGQPQDTLPELQRGENGTNVAMTYGTSGENLIYDVRVLQDNLGAQPVYQPAPVVRLEVIQQYPQINDLLRPVFASLDSRTLSDLNLATANSTLPRDVAAEQVALSYLVRAGFLDGAPPPAEPCVVQRPRDGDLNANLRDQPNLSGEVVGVMSPGVRLPADSQAVDSQDFRWWRVRAGNEQVWVREDTVDELGTCEALDFFDN
jgi:osmoprotectant transport system substrate-binding protein